MSSDVMACLFLLPVCSQPEDKQRAAAAFAQLQGAMETLGISESEQRAIWRVLVAIYHLGAAGACKGTCFSSNSPGLPAVSAGSCRTRPFSPGGGTGSVCHLLCLWDCSLEAAEPGMVRRKWSWIFQGNLIGQHLPVELSAMMVRFSVQYSGCRLHVALSI